jgi:hypothetical protein
VAWADAPTPPFGTWLKPFSFMAGQVLQTEARPDADEVWFAISLSVVTTNTGGLSSSNRVQVDFLAAPRADRIYLTRVTNDPAFTQPATPFLCVTNLRSLTAQGGQLALPDLLNASNGAVYGACDLVVRKLNTDRSACELKVASAGDSSVTLTTRAQVGATIVDTVETRVDPNGGATWQTVARFTNTVAPTATNFDTGWQELSYAVDTSALPAASQHFFRLSRAWLPQ